MSLARCVRFHVGPLASSKPEAMDCSGDTAEHAATHIDGIETPTPPLPLSPTMASLACGLGSGEISELDDGGVDGPFDTPLSFHVTTFELPREWLDVYRALDALPLDRGRSRTGSHRQIIPGCVSFAACVDLSRAFALKVDIDAIEATASTLLANGKGIDRDVMSQHMLTIQRQGMGKALSQFSEQTLSTTLHPRPHYVLLPPSRHPPLPVHPHPALVQHLTAEQKRLRDDHIARIVVPPPL